jgi:hypothetical protein
MIRLRSHVDVVWNDDGGAIEAVTNGTGVEGGGLLSDDGWYGRGQVGMVDVMVWCCLCCCRGCCWCWWVGLVVLAAVHSGLRPPTNAYRSSTLRRQQPTGIRLFPNFLDFWWMCRLRKIPAARMAWREERGEGGGEKRAAE